MKGLTIIESDLFDALGDDQKFDYIINADLIVHPAEYEGYGIAILESLIL